MFPYTYSLNNNPFTDILKIITTTNPFVFGIPPAGIIGHHSAVIQLIDAIAQGHEGAAEKLLYPLQIAISLGADINKADYNGRTALMYAAAHGHTGAVELLLKAGADINKGANDGRTALTEAVYKENVEIVKLLLKAGADVDEAGYGDNTALIWAVRDIEIVRLLIEAGADVNKANNRGDTALIMAAQNCDITEVMELLLKAGADVNKANNDGDTALIWAADYGDIDKVRLLIESGADVNKANNDGRTALIKAAADGCSENYMEIVKLLLKVGADPKLVYNNGDDALGEITHEDVELVLSYREEYKKLTKTAAIAWKQAVGEDLSNEETLFLNGPNYNLVFAKDFLKAKAIQVTEKIKQDIELTKLEDKFLDSPEFNQLDNSLLKGFYNNADLTKSAISAKLGGDLMMEVLDFLPKASVFKAQTSLIASGLKQYLMQNFRIRTQEGPRPLTSEEMNILGFDSGKMIKLYNLIAQNKVQELALRKGEKIDLHSILTKLEVLQESRLQDYSEEERPKKPRIENTDSEQSNEEKNYCIILRVSNVYNNELLNHPELLDEAMKLKGHQASTAINLLFELRNEKDQILDSIDMIGSKETLNLLLGIEEKPVNLENNFLLIKSDTNSHEPNKAFDFKIDHDVIQNHLFKAALGFKYCDTGIDAMRMVYIPTIDNIKKTANKYFSYNFYDILDQTHIKLLDIF